VINSAVTFCETVCTSVYLSAKIHMRNASHWLQTLVFISARNSATNTLHVHKTCKWNSQSVVMCPCASVL